MTTYLEYVTSLEYLKSLEKRYNESYGEQLTLLKHGNPSTWRYTPKHRNEFPKVFDYIYIPESENKSDVYLSFSGKEPIIVNGMYIPCRMACHTIIGAEKEFIFEAKFVTDEYHEKERHKSLFFSSINEKVKDILWYNYGMLRPMEKNEIKIKYGTER